MSDLVAGPRAGDDVRRRALPVLLQAALACLGIVGGLLVGVGAAPPAAAAANNFHWPVTGTVPAGDVAWHRSHENGARAVDIGTTLGATVGAAQTGTVYEKNNLCPDDGVATGTTTCGHGFGNYVILRHDRAGVSQPLYTLYAHLAAASVTVTRGAPITTIGAPLGKIAMSGHTEGPHTHFAIGTCPTPWSTGPADYDTNCTIWNGPDTTASSVTAGTVMPGSYPQLVAVSVASPTLTGVTYANGGAKLTFTPPPVPAGVTIRNYAYQVSCNGGTSWTVSSTTAGNTSPQIVGGNCPQGTIGSYRIAARLDATTGAWSAWRAVGPAITAPTITSATYANGGASLTFTPPPVPAGVTIRNYAYQVSCNGGTSWTVSSTTAGNTSPQIVGGNCPQGTIGSYRIAARLDATTGAWSAWRAVG
jgi:hypothetical protein